MDDQAVNVTLQKLEAAQSEVSNLLKAERYDEALDHCEAMYRLATTLPTEASPQQIDMLASLFVAHQEMTTAVTSALQRFQTNGRKRQQAISGYGKR
mgnify:CR=1 FL=1